MQVFIRFIWEDFKEVHEPTKRTKGESMAIWRRINGNYNSYFSCNLAVMKLNNLAQAYLKVRSFPVGCGENRLLFGISNMATFAHTEVHTHTLTHAHKHCSQNVLCWWCVLRVQKDQDNEFQNLKFPWIILQQNAYGSIYFRTFLSSLLLMWFLYFEIDMARARPKVKRIIDRERESETKRAKTSQTS